LIDGDGKIASHLRPGLISLGPDPKLKGSGRGRDVDDMHSRRRVFGDVGVIGGNLLEQVGNVLQIRTRRHTDRDRNRASSVRQGPVGNLAGNEEPVWDNDLRTIIRSNNACPNNSVASLPCISRCFKPDQFKLNPLPVRSFGGPKKGNGRGKLFHPKERPTLEHNIVYAS
jgi:hypothetical protein